MGHPDNCCALLKKQQTTSWDTTCLTCSLTTLTLEMANLGDGVAEGDDTLEIRENLQSRRGEQNAQPVIVVQ